MDITFQTSKLEKLFNSEKQLIRKFGAENSRVIMLRLAFLRATPSLEGVPHTRPFRRHQLTGDRKGEFAVDLKHPFRLLFKPDIEPIPRMPDGGVDLKRVTAIMILGVEDYH